MKRLLALIGFISFSVLTAAFYLGVKVALIIAAVCLVLLLISLCIPGARKEKTYPISFLTAFLASVMFLSYTFVNVYPLWNDYADATCTVTMTQTSQVYYSGRYYKYEMKIDSIDGKKENAKIIINCKTPLYTEPYDKVTMDCDIEKSDSSSLYSRGVFLSSYIYEGHEFTVDSPQKKPIMYQIIKFNNFMRRGLYTELPEDAGDFSAALLLGDKYAMDSENVELLRINGVSHISVVSGLHLSIITALLYKIFGKLIKNKYLSCLVTFIGVLFFAAFTGFGYSVIRAMVMQIVFIGGRLIMRRHDSLNSLGLAALVVLFINPYCVGDLGIQLSFLATLGIILLSDRSMNVILKIMEKHEFSKRLASFRFVRGILGAFVTTVCATIFTLPVGILAFGGFSGVGIVANVLLTPLIPVVLVSAALCALFHYVTFLPFLADSFAYVVKLYYRYLMFVCRSLAKLDYAYIRTDKIYFTVWLGLSLILVAIAVVIGKRKSYACAALMSLIILFAGGITYETVREDVVTLTIPYTGDGVTVIANNNDLHAVLTLGGSKQKSFLLEQALDRFSPTEKDVLISAGGKDHRYFEENTLSMFDYGTVLLYDNKEEDEPSELLNLSRNILTFSENYTVDLWDKALVYIESTQSGVYEYMTIGEKDILVLTVKLDSADIPEKFRTVDMIITRDVPHNAYLLKCHTLIIPGDDYKALAGAEVLSSITDEIITGNDITLDIDT